MVVMFVMLHGIPVRVYDVLIWSPVMTYVTMLSSVHISTKVELFVQAGVTHLGNARRRTRRNFDEEHDPLLFPQDTIGLDPRMEPTIEPYHDDFEDPGTNAGPEDEPGHIWTSAPSSQVNNSSHESQSSSSQASQVYQAHQNHNGFGITFCAIHDHLDLTVTGNLRRIGDRELDTQSISLSSASNETSPYIRSLVYHAERISDNPADESPESRATRTEVSDNHEPWNPLGAQQT